MNQNEQLLELVRSLSAQVNDLQSEIRSLKVKGGVGVPDDVLAAIAAAVAAYLGCGGERRLPRFAPVSAWVEGAHASRFTRTPQLVR